MLHEGLSIRSEPRNRLADLGFVCDTKLVDSSEMGAATARRRTWILALHCDRLQVAVEEGRTIISSCFKYVESLKMKKPLPLNAFLLDDTDPYVEAFFNQQVEQKRKDTAVGKDAAGGKWTVSLTKLLAKKGSVLSPPAAQRWVVSVRVEVRSSARGPI